MAFIRESAVQRVYIAVYWNTRRYTMRPQTAVAHKEKRLSIRASEPEKTILTQAARARHMNTSQFVLQASLDAAHAILVDQTEFRLPPEQWEAFCERLDAPARTIPALVQLFSEPEPFDA
jgi:uncharacterized protein (DUF1778 family)